MRRQRGRPWRCLLCPDHGWGPDVETNMTSFYKHYLKTHVERMGGQE